MRFFALILAAFLGACSRNPSAILDAAGPHAAITAKLLWYFIAVNGVIFVLVLGFLFVSLWRRRVDKIVAPVSLSADGERRLRIVVGISIGLTIVVLTSYVGFSYAVDKNLIDLDRRPDLAIEVTGHQWWWEVRYLDVTPSNVFTTANEIHVPVGATVRLILKSNDVIHSVWFPNLAGKRDVIPGHDQDLVIRADRIGVWRGRCAEFCGLQHAFMGLTLFIDSKADFEAWEKSQRLPAPEPQTAELQHGRDVFTNGACGTCHVIRGTQATGYSTNAPELTHLKSRTAIGAGAAPNSREKLDQWIQDPHSLKPGVHMPAILQKPEDYKALLDYLETLK